MALMNVTFQTLIHALARVFQAVSSAQKVSQFVNLVLMAVMNVMVQKLKSVIPKAGLYRTELFIF
jgi:hypothetical protein